MDIDKIRLYVSYAADLAAVILMIVQMFRTRRLSGGKRSLGQYFRLFSWMVLVMSVLHLLKSYADMELGVSSMEDFLRLSEADRTAMIWTEMTAGFIDIFLTTVFIYMWITFLCWHLFGDRDFIRRTFWFGFTPLIVSAAVTAVCIPVAVLSEPGFWFYIAVLILFFAIRILYFFIGFCLLREYKKQNGYLRFFNPWVFFVPVFAGWLLQDVFWWGFAALGSTLGLMLLYSSIVAEERYIDPETGLYNTDFTDYLKGLIGRKKYDPLSAMIFTLKEAGEMKDFSGILKKQLPKDCEPIRRGERGVVVLTGVKERGPLSMVLEDVKAASGAETDYTMKKKTETPEGFMDRVLA